MSTVKIAEPYKICLHPEHYAPSMMVFSPGTYRHTCPGCGSSYTFSVPLITL